MRRLALCGLYLIYCCLLGLGFYEATAKSPEWLGVPLPGWTRTFQAETSTRWDPSTGILPVDRFLHETEEAARFFGLMAQIGQPPFDPLLTATSSVADARSGP